MAASKSVFFNKILPTFYSVGAAVVIVGAWAKILHLSFANTMLTVGLLVEAAIFLAFAFQSYFEDESEYEWEKVYPELAKGYNGAPINRSNSAGSSNLTGQMDAALSSANITPEIFTNLKKSFESLTGQVGKISEISEATVATNEYTKNIKSATNAMGDMSKAYNSTMQSISEMNVASGEIKDLKAQFAQVSQKMASLNSIYETELTDTSKHLKTINGYYSNLSNTMSDLNQAGKDTEQFKNELSKLTGNLASLNNVYGSMLSAMKG